MQDVDRLRATADVRGEKEHVHRQALALYQERYGG